MCLSGPKAFLSSARGSQFLRPVVVGLREPVPDSFGDVVALVDEAREREQGVGEAVQVGDSGLVDGLLGGERDGAAFGAATDRTCLMELRTGVGSTGQDKGT